MLPDTVFSFVHGSPEQAIAFIGFVIATVAFFIWVAYLVRW